jgi:lipoprotein NlpI
MLAISEGPVVMRKGLWSVNMRFSLVVALFVISTVWGEDDRLSQALQAAKENKSEQAVALLSDAIKEQPDLPEAYYWRGRELFRLGEIDKSLADFDKYVGLKPQASSSQWERGITCYYARKFEAGAKQFEEYQTYHDQDVENSVWRYLCVVPTAGVEKARENMLPIKNDPRIPMMDIYDLYRGKKTPDDVFAAAKAGSPGEDALKGRLFYAHLYVGLYYESLGKDKEARPHIVDAANKYRTSRSINPYMGDVARIHAQRLTEDQE